MSGPLDARAPEGNVRRNIGRYELHGEIASGGMASVHFGRLLGPVGFARTVAIKRLHPQFARDPEFVAMFLDEARVAARIRHPCVAATIDVVATRGELFLVMEYVHGESLARLLRTQEKVPFPIAGSVLAGALHGLHAAHVATSENGEPLGIVHRDVSPENVLVGVDGIARVLDFGIAYAAGRAHVTREGRLKGKLAYMAPELLEGGRATPRADVYAAGIVLWEALTGERLFAGENEGRMLRRILSGDVPAVSSLRSDAPKGTDDLVRRAVAVDEKARFATAHDFATEIERVLGVAPASAVGAWVKETAKSSLAWRENALAEVEGHAPRVRARRDDDGTTRIASPQINVAEVTEVDVVAPRPDRKLPEEGTATTLVVRAPPEAPPEPAPKNRKLPVVAAAALSLAFVVTAFVFLLRARPRGELAAAPPPPSPPSVAPASEPPPLPPIADVSATPSASASIVASPRPSSSVAPPSHRGGRGRPSVPRSSECDVPYTVDARGFHHFKPACL